MLSLQLCTARYCVFLKLRQDGHFGPLLHLVTSTFGMQSAGATLQRQSISASARVSRGKIGHRASHTTRDCLAYSLSLSLFIVLHFYLTDRRRQLRLNVLRGSEPMGLMIDDGG